MHEPYHEHDALTIMAKARVTYMIIKRGGLEKEHQELEEALTIAQRLVIPWKNDDLGVDYSNYNLELVIPWELHNKFNKG